MVYKSLILVDFRVVVAHTVRAEAVIADLQEIIDSIRRGEPDPDPPKPVRQKRPSEMSPIERLDDADKMDKLWKNLSR